MSPHSTSPSVLGNAIEQATTTPENKQNANEHETQTTTTKDTAGRIVSMTQDISRYQLQLNEDERKLEHTKEKLRKFEELADSLRVASPTTLTVLAPLLENMRTERHCLETKVEQDTKRLAEAWEEVLNIFLRAICQQFDKEVEAGTEFLYQEARVLFNTLSRKYIAPGSKPTGSSSNIAYFPEESSKETMCPNNRSTINSSEYMRRQEKMISKMQEQLNNQSEKVEFLLRRNELNLHGQDVIPPQFSL